MGTAVEPLVRRLNVVYLYVSDIARSTVFYRDLLGVPLEGDDDWQEASLRGTRFALHRVHEGIGELSSGTVDRAARPHEPHSERLGDRLTERYDERYDERYNERRDALDARAAPPHVPLK